MNLHITREGRCIYCGTLIISNLENEHDKIRFINHDWIECPICVAKVDMIVKKT